ncbi:hypothetical protein VTH82DRAFT_536 [Thermothelomyces myriococcoides]
MPTYRHPPPTPSSGSLSSRSNSFSHSSQTERGNKTTTATISNRPSSSTLEFGKRERLGAGGYEKKFPYLFLGGVAAVSLLAHKYWPKGFTYGEKEDWELSDLALRAKHRRLAEKAERAEKAARQVARECSRRRERRGGGGWCEGSDCNAYDDAAEGLRGRGPGYRGGPANCYSYAGEAHGHTGDAIDWDRPRDPMIEANCSQQLLLAARQFKNATSLNKTCRHPACRAEGYGTTSSETHRLQSQKSWAQHSRVIMMTAAPEKFTFTEIGLRGRGELFST